MNKKIRKKRGKFSLILQISLLFVAAVVVIGFITNMGLLGRSLKGVQEQTEAYAAAVSREVKDAVREYPAYKWLLSYWYEHAGELEIEYDTNFREGSATKEKIRLLQSRQPGFLIRYAEEEQVLALPEEDRKLYAEIAYSWLITRLNDIKRDHDLDFLFCVVTDESFSSQFFLFSAGDGVTERGSEYAQIYPLGVTVSVNKMQSDGMADAMRNDSHLAMAGVYADYYSSFEMVGGKPALIGLTYDLGGLADSVVSETLSGVLFNAVIIIMLALSCLILIIRVVLKPIKKIQSGIRNYIETKDSKKAAEELSVIRHRNEIGQLADDIVDLAQEMDAHLEHIRVITEEKGRIQSELDMAAAIQMSMMPQEFPPFPERQEFDLHAFIDPAKEVGGDFYDFFFIDDDHLCLVIADVSGKGVPAALFMMIAKVILKSCAMLGKSAGEILEKTNEGLCSSNKMEMFVTVWIGILEVSTGKLTAANAGHEYPVFKKNDGCFGLLKNRHGPAIGVFSGSSYVQYEMQLQPGERIFVYTDGLAEATDAEENMFGTERIVAVLNETPDAAPEELVEHMKTAVDGFVKEAVQFDDLTMLCMQYNGTEEK